MARLNGGVFVPPPCQSTHLIAQLREKQLAENSVRYCQRILSSALSSDDFAQQMGVNLNINTVTTRYVQVQEQRKLHVLTAYHQAVFATHAKWGGRE